MSRIILYDGKCNLCCGAARFVKKHDRLKRFNFTSQESKEGESLLQKSGFTGKDLNTLIYIAEGRYYKRSSAVLHIFKDMGGTWKLLYGFIIVPHFLSDFLYILVAKTRFRIFGKRDGCLIPEE